MRLAALWGCPIWEAKARCTIEEFRTWVRLFEKQPWGDHAMDARLSILCATVAGAAGAKRPRPSDFFPWLAGPVGPQSAEEWDAKRGAIMASMRLAGASFEKPESSNAGA